MACSSIRESPKYQFVDGIYSAKLPEYKSRKVFIHVEEDSILVYPTLGKNGQYVLDSINRFQFTFPKVSNQKKNLRASFTKNSFDLDLITTPIKFRPATASVPNQVNANVNGSVFVGYRVDYFRISYKPNLLGDF
jgi:hypothetical protein